MPRTGCSDRDPTDPGGRGVRCGGQPQSELGDEDLPEIGIDDPPAVNPQCAQFAAQLNQIRGEYQSIQLPVPENMVSQLNRDFAAANSMAYAAAQGDRNAQMQIAQIGARYGINCGGDGNCLTGQLGARIQAQDNAMRRRRELTEQFTMVYNQRQRLGNCPPFQ
jgi:hypothetical protein